MSETTELARPRARGIIQDVIQALVDDHTLSNRSIAAATGHSERVIAHMRKSDSFRSLLAKAYEIRHGEAIQTARAAQLATAVVAMKGMAQLIQSEAVLPMVKIEAAKVLIQNHNAAEERLIPKVAQGPAAQVSISISVEELQAARQASLTQGNEIVLEESDASHSPAIPGQFPQYNLPVNYQERAKLRGEGK